MIVNKRKRMEEIAAKFFGGGLNDEDFVFLGKYPNDDPDVIWGFAKAIAEAKMAKVIPEPPPLEPDIIREGDTGC